MTHYFQIGDKNFRKLNSFSNLLSLDESSSFDICLHLVPSSGTIIFCYSHLHFELFQMDISFFRNNNNNNNYSSKTLRVF